MKGRRVPPQHHRAECRPEPLTLADLRLPERKAERAITEADRLAACRNIAERMYRAGLGDCYNALERLTRPELDLLRVAFPERMPEPTLYERGVLDRYQDGRGRK
jgi:hypothetical protein